MSPERTPTSLRRSGVSLVELLVAIGIFGILVGLLLPSVQAAREAARRARCAVQLRTLVQAVHLFESSRGVFPPRQFTGRDHFGQRCILSAHAGLLPYLEQKPLFDALNFQGRCITIADLSGANATVARTVINSFLCPSDPLAGNGSWAANSYRGNYGVNPFHKNAQGIYEIVEDGAFVAARPPLRVADFQDGLSQTLIFSEKPVGSGTATRHSPFRDWYRVKEIPDTGARWLAHCSHLVSDETPSFGAGRTWLLTGGMYTGFYATAPPNSTIPDCGTPHFQGAGLFTARSYHPGGVNAAMADGSVRWFTSSTNVRIWQALGSRAGGEAID